MTERISLVEAYDNRDVIAQLVRLRDNVDELLNILKDIDPNGDLTNVVTKTGDQTIDGVKTFIGQIVADCDIIQNGAAYETHAEQVYSVNDLIVTRDGQITGLAPGDMSGFHVKKYNGVDDSRLGVDSTGTMRVGDVGQEQPLATRDEEADMVSGAYVRWDGVNKKLIAPDVDLGSDTRPIYLADGAPVAVAAPFALASSVATGSISATPNTLVVSSVDGLSARTFGKVVVVKVEGAKAIATGYNQKLINETLPVPANGNMFSALSGPSGQAYGLLSVNTSGECTINVGTAGVAMYGSITYISV